MSTFVPNNSICPYFTQKKSAAESVCCHIRHAVIGFEASKIEILNLRIKYTDTSKKFENKIGGITQSRLMLDARSS